MTSRDVEAIFHAIDAYPLPQPYHDNLVRLLNAREQKESRGEPVANVPLSIDQQAMLYLYRLLRGAPLARPATWLTH